MNGPAASVHYYVIATLGVAATAFGLLTVYSGGSVLFIDGSARVAAGHYVPFVVWFNFLAGFAYIIAGADLLASRRRVVYLSIVIAVATIIVFAVFGLHIAFGGEYEARTVFALILRSLVWFIIAVVSWRILRKKAPKQW